MKNINFLSLFMLVFLISCSPLKNLALKMGDKRSSIQKIVIEEVCTPGEFLTTEFLTVTNEMFYSRLSLSTGSYFGITGAVHSVSYTSDDKLLVCIGDYYYKNHREFACIMANDSMKSSINEGDRITLIGKYSGMFIEEELKQPLVKEFTINFEDCFILCK